MAFGWSFPILVFVYAGVTVLFTYVEWPDGRDKVVIWWDVHGDTWLWLPPWLGYLLLPLLGFLLSIALYLAIGSVNLNSHGKESKEALRNIILLPACFLLATQVAILATDPGAKCSAHLFRNLFCASHMSFGIFIMDVEPNSVIGIITPWTTASNWKALHQKAGFVFCWPGLLILAARFVPIGLPMLVAALVLGLGPWIIIGELRTRTPQTQIQTQGQTPSWQLLHVAASASKVQ